jgi:heat shock protein HslJ
MRKLALSTVLALSITACLGSDFADSIEGSWQMASGSVNGEAIPVLDTHPIIITFEEGQVSGTAACNAYGGTFDLDGSNITFSDLTMTEMACTPEETMRAEALFASAITVVDTITLDGQLVLSGDGVEMVFEPMNS